MHRRHKDGNLTGLKQDRFRHSDFEYQEQNQPDQYFSRSASPNTIGGKWAENRGHRSADDNRHPQDNPFENGKIRNWNHKQGWDQFFNQKSVRAGRSGGAIIQDDETDHSRRGPKGYQRPDSRIFEEVCDSLFASRDVDASDMQVEVKDGCVFLKGEVESREMKKLAEQEIEMISGVRDVQNLLSLKKAA